MVELICKIHSILFSKRDTGFFILKAIPEGGGSLVAVKGSFPGVVVNVGLRARFSGKYEDHATYGRQMVASTCEIIPDKGKAGIVTYLINHVRSIGPITADRLYGAYGEKLLEVLETDSEAIRTLDFLTGPQADAIIQEWKESSEARTVSIFLSELGLNTFQIKSVYSRFGTETRPVIRNDPYRLYECAGVGFATADVAARKVGVGVDDPRRIRALVLFTLQELAQSEGHMYAHSGQILEHVKKVFRRHGLAPFLHGEYIAESDFYDALGKLKELGSLVCSNDRIYLAHNWNNESSAATCVADISCQPPFPFKDLSGSLADFEKGRNLTLSDDQREAFMMLSHSRLCVVSGYPGTGKTLLISAFVHLFEKSNLQYSLLSPTGIAAKRLSQMTGKPGYTIHRALGYKRDGSWEFNVLNEYDADAVIVDEMSMVDGSTFYHLMSALKPSTIVIMVGDSAQLPSVGAGYVLNNLMRCESVPHVSLTRIYRQDKQSDIITTAHAILRGDPIDTSLYEKSEFVFLQYNRELVIDEVCKMASRMKARDANFQVIAPKYDGDLGVNNLNIKLREHLNPEYALKKAQKIKHGDADLYEGDRVMVTRNDYDRMIFNGDVGKVQRISLKNDEVEVKIFDWFDHESPVPRYYDKVFTFKVEEVRQVLRVAYACTAHKCQGQEFDYVVMPMTMQYGIMLYKNLVYTAITRAKKKVFVFGEPGAFQFAVRNDRETVRNSALADLISEYATEERLDAVS